MTSFGLFTFCTTLKKLNTLMANLLLLFYILYIYLRLQLVALLAHNYILNNGL